MSEESLQVWVRNDKGKVYGPLSPPSVELLIDNGIIDGKLQVSTNGQDYVYPGRVPGLRMLFPKATWGDQVVPGDELDAQWSQVAMPAALPGAAPAGPPVSGSGVRAPVAGPGARAPAGGPVAGPGARAPTQRPFNPAQHAQSRPSSPGFKSSPSVADFMTSPSQVAAPPRVSSPSQPPRSAPSVAGFPPIVGAPPAAPRVAPAPVAAPRAPVPVTNPGDVTMPASGTLDQHAPPQLYYLAGSGELTGLLTLKLSDRELSVHFKRGNPEAVDSTHAEDALGTFLEAQRLVTPDQLAQAQRELPRFGGELLPALFGLGLVNPNNVFPYLGQRAAGLLFRFLSAESGSFTFDAIELPPAKSMPLGNRWAVYLEALRKLPYTDLRRRMAKAWDYPVMKAGGKLSHSDVRLTPQETRALNYFDGVRSLAQLVNNLQAEAEVLVRTAFMLHPLELVSFAGVTVSSTPPPFAPPPGSSPSRPAVAPPSAPRAIAPPPAPVIAPPTAAPPRAIAPPPAPVIAPPRAIAPPVMAPPTAAPPRTVSSPSGIARPPAAPPVMRPPPPVMHSPPVSSPSSPAMGGDDVPRLQALLAKWKTQTYFEVLGVTKDADANAVKVAYLKAARSYHPDTVPPNSPEALAKVKADLFALAGEANRTLSDVKLREDYVAELSGGGPVDMEKIFRAEERFQKGTILVKTRKYADAVQMFNDAIDDNRDEPEFYAWRGYARFLAAPDKKLALTDALRDIKDCVSRNPRVASAHYFLGFIAKTNGDLKAAKAHFQECVKLDPRHVDAARELKSMK